MIAQIKPSQLAAWLDSVRPQGEPLVLDVREPMELEMASVTANGFKLQTIPMGDIPQRLNELDPAQPVACLCHHGARSMQVATYLKAQGFEQVVNVAGGIHAWSAELDTAVPVY